MQIHVMPGVHAALHSIHHGLHPAPPPTALYERFGDVHAVAVLH